MMDKISSTEVIRRVLAREFSSDKRKSSAFAYLRLAKIINEALVNVGYLKSEEL